MNKIYGVRYRCPRCKRTVVAQVPLEQVQTALNFELKALYCIEDLVQMDFEFLNQDCQAIQPIYSKEEIKR